MLFICLYKTPMYWCMAIIAEKMEKPWCMRNKKNMWGMRFLLWLVQGLLLSGK